MKQRPAGGVETCGNVWRLRVFGNGNPLETMGTTVDPVETSGKIHGFV